MRLIDAHDVIAKIEKMETVDVVDVVESIIMSPTIDAIPVKWIIEWSAEHMTEFGTLTVERMLEDWRKSVEPSSADVVKKTN